jgi:hypothetical protein
MKDRYLIFQAYIYIHFRSFSYLSRTLIEERIKNYIYLIKVEIETCT